jgi:hypothetical protein
MDRGATAIVLELCLPLIFLCWSPCSSSWHSYAFLREIMRMRLLLVGRLGCGHIHTYDA